MTQNCVLPGKICSVILFILKLCFKNRNQNVNIDTGLKVYSNQKPNRIHCGTGARARAQIIRMYYCQQCYRCLLTATVAGGFVCILNERIHEVLCTVLEGLGCASQLASLHQTTVVKWVVIKKLYTRCLMVSTNQADPSCFYFRIS